MDREKMREAIAEAIDYGYVTATTYWETADAILAAIGNPDATGDVMGRDQLQEAIAKAIFEETTSQEQRPGWTEPGQERKVTDLNAKSARVIRRAAGVIVGIVAKSGYDATGDLLMRAAESGYPPALIGQADNTWVACVHNGTFGANMSGPTPADALRAAILAVEEGR